MKKFIALVMKEKRPGMNMKMMTTAFFELYTVHIKNYDNFFQYFTRYMHRSVVSHKYLKLISGV